MGPHALFWCKDINVVLNTLSKLSINQIKFFLPWADFFWYLCVSLCSYFRLWISCPLLREKQEGRYKAFKGAIFEGFLNISRTNALNWIHLNTHPPFPSLQTSSWRLRLNKYNMLAANNEINTTMIAGYLSQGLVRLKLFICAVYGAGRHPVLRL